MNKNPNVDQYLIDGCGRCKHYKTPNCKVNTWRSEVVELRRIALTSGLKEEYKWSQPCYTYNGKNVLIVSAFKDYAFISFFKGSLLKDDMQILFTPGKSSQAARQFRFTTVQEIFDTESIIKRYIQEAMAIEKAGKNVAFKKNPETIPEELEIAFGDNPEFKDAFDNLTPGRQRGYILNFSQPKQSKTRSSRIQKWMPNIMNGKGIHDNYRSVKKSKSQ